MRTRAIGFLREVVRWRARRNLRKHPLLWNEVTSYMKTTRSTGVSWSDFWELYKAVRTQKPREILECGPGASTVAMAIAAMENAKEGRPARITAMEEQEEWLRESVALLPRYLEGYVEFRLSPRVDDHFEIFRGVRYRDTPRRDYDFVFIDGPEHHSIVDGSFCFDFDFIHVLLNSPGPTSGLIDYRLSTVFVLQRLLGPDKVRFDLLKELGSINPVRKSDLKRLTLEGCTAGLLTYGRMVGNTRVRVY